MRILEKGKPLAELEGLGAWSSSDEDYRLNLNDAWKAVRSDGRELGEIDIPFCWDDWKGELTLSRSVILSDEFKNRSNRLVVEGFAEYIAVKLNGAHLDARRGDGLSFQIPLDPRQLYFESDLNEIEITLDNRLPRSGGIPLTGSVYARRRYGGVHRDIYLISSPLTAFTDLVTRWIEDSPNNGGHVEVDAELRRMFHLHTDSADVVNQIEFTLLDPSGNRIASNRLGNIDFPPGGVLRLSSSIKSDHLERWGLTSSPVLYKVYGLITTPNTSHSIESRFGVRTFSINTNGFLLNGEKIWLRCISYPEIRPGYGAIVDERRLEADVAKMKDLGVHAVRILHGSASLSFLDICDRYGLLVFEELPVFQAPDPILSEPELIRSALEQLEAMIRRDGRFTCIAGWGIGAQINPPNRSNRTYYEQLTEKAHGIDKRPVYASFPFRREFTAEPLDFAILEITPYSDVDEPALIDRINGDRPFLIGGIRRAVQPGNLGGYADPASEAGQADYILRSIQQAENISGCAGIVFGDFADWEGAVPSVSGPLKGQSNVYTTGICGSTGNPRLAYHRIKEYWASGRAQPLSRGESPGRKDGLIIAVGLGLIIIFFIAIRRNNLLKFNLSRTFTSPKGFFHDVGDRRYSQTGQTILIAMLISCGFGLLCAGWFFANRQSYSLDWVLGYLLSDSELLRWTANMVWQPARAAALFSVVVFIILWLASIRVVLLCKMLGRRRSLAQGIAFVTWSSAAYLSLLPVGMLSKSLFDASLGWFVLVFLILVSLWSHQRLMSVIIQQVHRSAAVVNALWFIGPIILMLIIFAGLEYTRDISEYWGFFWGTIVQ